MEIRMFNKNLTPLQQYRNKCAVAHIKRMNREQQYKKVMAAVNAGIHNTRSAAA